MPTGTPTMSAISASGCPAWWCRTKTARCSRRQPRERAIEGVPVVDRDHRVGPARSVDRQDPDPGAPSPMPPQLLVTGIDEEPMEPWGETLRIAQPREFTPGEEECLLDGVLRPFAIPKDPDTRSRSTGHRPGRRVRRRRHRRRPGPVRPASSAWAGLQRRPGWALQPPLMVAPVRGSMVTNERAANMVGGAS